MTAQPAPHPDAARHVDAAPHPDLAPDPAPQGGLPGKVAVLGAVGLCAVAVGAAAKTHAPVAVTARNPAAPTALSARRAPGMRAASR